MSPAPRDLPLLLLGVCSCPPHPGVCPCPSQVSHLAFPVDTDVIAVLPARGPVHHGRRPLRVEVEALGQAVEGTGLDTPWGRSQEKMWKTRRMPLEEGPRHWSWTPEGTLSWERGLDVTGKETKGFVLIWVTPGTSQVVKPFCPLYQQPN